MAALTGSYAFNGTGWPRAPLVKNWRANRIATRGSREPIFAAIWQLDLQFGTLQVTGESDFFESRFLTGGSYTARLPHPVTGLWTTFTGVAIEECSFDFGDVDNVGGEYWATNPRVVLSVNLQATGT